MQRSDGREPARERSVSPGLTAAVDELPQEGTARSLLERWRSIEHEAKVGLQHRHRIDKYLDTLLANQPISDGEATDRCKSLRRKMADCPS